MSQEAITTVHPHTNSLRQSLVCFWHLTSILLTLPFEDQARRKHMLVKVNTLFDAGSYYSTWIFMINFRKKGSLLPRSNTVVNHLLSVLRPESEWGKEVAKFRSSAWVTGLASVTKRKHFIRLHASKSDENSRLQQMKWRFIEGNVTKTRVTGELLL